MKYSFGRISKSFKRIKDSFGRISKSFEQIKERSVNVTDDHTCMSGLSVQCIRTNFCDSNIYMNCVAVKNTEVLLIKNAPDFWKVYKPDHDQTEKSPDPGAQTHTCIYFRHLWFTLICKLNVI